MYVICMFVTTMSYAYLYVHVYSAIACMCDDQVCAFIVCIDSMRHVRILKPKIEPTYKYAVSACVKPGCMYVYYI